MRSIVAVLAFAVPAAVVHAEASSTPAEGVRRYFQALDHQDFEQAIALTDGGAKARTSSMIDRLKKAAAAHRVTVEVRVKHLEVRTPGSPDPSEVLRCFARQTFQHGLH
jgi:hypothetical protein